MMQLDLAYNLSNELADNIQEDGRFTTLVNNKTFAMMRDHLRFFEVPFLFFHQLHGIETIICFDPKTQYWKISRGSDVLHARHNSFKTYMAFNKRESFLTHVASSLYLAENYYPALDCVVSDVFHEAACSLLLGMSNLDFPVVSSSIYGLKSGSFLLYHNEPNLFYYQFANWVENA